MNRVNETKELTGCHIIGTLSAHFEKKGYVMLRIIPACVVFAVFIVYAVHRANAQELAPVEVEPYIQQPTQVPINRAKPLQNHINVVFPTQIKTIGQAMQYLLAGSGWSLATGQSVDPMQATLLAQPLPEVQRELSNCPLWHAMSVLADQDVYQMELDRPNRLIAFVLKERYRSWRGATIITQKVAKQKQAPQPRSFPGWSDR